MSSEVDDTMAEGSMLEVFVFRGREFVGSEIFTEREIVIGRGANVSLFLDDPAVADEHAILTCKGNEASLHDLGSSRGTSVNSTRVRRSALTPRDEIAIGSYRLKIKFVQRSPTARTLRPSPEAASRATTFPASSAPRDDFAIDEATELLGGANPARAIQAAPKRDIGSSVDSTPAFEVTGSSVLASEPATPVAFERRVAASSDAREAQSVEDALDHAFDLARQLGSPVVSPHDFGAGGEPTKQLRPSLLHEERARMGAPREEEHDEDAADEEAEPGFSLLESVLHASAYVAPVEGSTERALEIVAFSGGHIVEETVLTTPGDTLRLGRGRNGRSFPAAGQRGLRLARMPSKGDAKIRFPASASGYLENAEGRVPLDSLATPANALSKKAQHFEVSLPAGAEMQLDFGSHGFRIRFVRRASVAKEKRTLRFEKKIQRAFGSSLLVHVLVFAIVGMAATNTSYGDRTREEWTELRQDVRDVKIPEPEPPPPPEPVPAVEPEKTPDPEPPQVTPKKSAKKAAAPVKEVTKQAVKSAGVLGAMGKLNLAAPGKASILQKVSNIDAVHVPGGSNFRVGALVGKTPSSELSLGAGGGGAPLTRGAAALLAGGEGFGKIEKKSAAQVRGRVDRVATHQLRAQGSISREDVALVINKHLREIQYCYEKTLLKEPGLAGKLVLEWTIQPSGSVGRVKQQVSTLRNPEVASCIMRGLERWQFPKPKGGVVIVSYPFVFSSVGF